MPFVQILACEANTGGGPELGHLASARNLAKLNAISPAVFPLPPAMATPSSEDIYIPDEPESPVSSVSGTEDTVVETAVGAGDVGRKHLLQIRVQSGIDAGMDLCTCPLLQLLCKRPHLQVMQGGVHLLDW